MSKIRLPNDDKIKKLTKERNAALAKYDRLNTLLSQKVDLLVAQQAKIDQLETIIRENR